MRGWWPLALLFAACSTVRVTYPSTFTRPKVVAIQLYLATAWNEKRANEVYRFHESYLVEVGCTEAAFAAGMEVARWRQSIVDETETTYTYKLGSIDATEIRPRTGADVVITGMVRLLPRSLRMAEVKLEAHSGVTNDVVATADLRDDDGADPVSAGRRLCGELFRGWR